MSEPFKTRVEPTETVEAPLAPVVVEHGEVAEEFHTQNEQEMIELFETEKGHKYSEDYFGLREVSAGDFNVKMIMAKIDKFVKGEIESKEFDKTLTNYRSILNEIESKVNSTQLNGRARLNKILAYIGLMKKTAKLEELKKKVFG